MPSEHEDYDNYDEFGPEPPEPPEIPEECLVCANCVNNYMNIIINNRKLLEAHVRTARAIISKSDALLRDVDAHPETKPMALVWLKQAELWAVNRGDERLASLMRITAMIAKFPPIPAGYVTTRKYAA